MRRNIRLGVIILPPPNNVSPQDKEKQNLSFRNQFEKKTKTHETNDDTVNT